MNVFKEISASLLEIKTEMTLARLTLREICNKSDTRKVFYLCDGERKECSKNTCFKTGCENPCRHTTDIRHAVNFGREDGHSSYRESVREEIKTSI